MWKWKISNITDDSAITCDEVIDSYKEETETISTNFKRKNVTFRTQNLYNLLAFLLTAIALSRVVSIYFYLIKYQAKQKHLLPFHNTTNELKEVMY